MGDTLYFDVDHALKEHDNIISISGGLEGLRDIGLLESVLSHIQNDTYYPTFPSKLTHLVFSIAMNHAFTDGNKRSSIALGAFFLEINRYESLVGLFIIEMENIVLWVAKNKVSKDLLREIIESLVINRSISEEVKLKIINVLSVEDLQV